MNAKVRDKIARVERMRRYRAKNKAKGVCQYNPTHGPPADGVTMCEACRATHRRQKKDMRAERMARGLCIDCGLSPATNGQRCRECQDILNVHILTSRARRAEREAGVTWDGD